MILFLLSKDFLQDVFVIKENLLPGILKRRTPFASVLLKPMVINNLPSSIEEQFIIPKKNGAPKAISRWEDKEATFAMIATAVEQHVRVLIKGR